MVKKIKKDKLKIEITPSILSADFSNLAGEIKKVSNANRLHIDVMDGHFVNNITIGAVVVESVRKATKLPMDTHLMIEMPEKYVGAFAKAGSTTIIFHPVATKNSLEVIEMIKAAGCKVGVCINPDIPVKTIIPYLNDVDQVLIMSVYAGFGGQKFIPQVLSKIVKLRKLGFKKEIAIDGGINDETIKLAAKAGANVFIAGNYVFKNKNPRQAVETLRKNAKSNSARD